MLRIAVVDQRPNRKASQNSQDSSSQDSSSDDLTDASAFLFIANLSADAQNFLAKVAEFHVFRTSVEAENELLEKLYIRGWASKLADSWRLTKGFKKTIDRYVNDVGI